MSSIELFLHKFYAASIFVNADGSMLVASNRERVMAWGLLFCVIAAVSLTSLLVWRKNRSAKRLSLAVFILSLVIPVFILPSVRQEYIRVSPEKIILETGAWYRPSRTEINFKDLYLIREKSAGVLPSNLIGDPDVAWHMSWRDGRESVLELNDFFNAHRMVVAIYMQDRGYPVARLEDQKRISPAAGQTGR